MAEHFLGCDDTDVLDAGGQTDLSLLSPIVFFLQDIGAEKGAGEDVGTSPICCAGGYDWEVSSQINLLPARALSHERSKGCLLSSQNSSGETFAVGFA